MKMNETTHPRVLTRTTLVLAMAIAFGLSARAQSNSNPTPAQPATASPTALSGVATPSPANGGKATASAASAAAPGNSGDTTQLQKVVVQGVTPEASILPLRPINSIYGTDTTILDTPRSVSQISQDQLIRDNIQGVSDLARYSPGVTPSGGQNRQVAPTIRGQEGEIYQDGMLLGNAPHPFDVNAYQAADVVAGPAPAVFGPTLNTSGYINYVTKDPYWDGFHGEFNTTLGKWDSGGQGGYPAFNEQLDFGAPIVKDELAYRVSYQQQEGDTYYTNLHNDWENGYAALSWIPTKNIEADWNFDFANYDYSEFKGWNRVTQDLVDNSTYEAGRATPILKTSTGAFYSPVDTGPTAFNGTSFVSRTQVSPGNFVAGGAFVPPAAGGSVVGWVMNPANVTDVKLYPYENEYGNDDAYRTKNFIAQQKVKVTADDDLTVVNSSTYQNIYHTKDSMDSFWTVDKHQQFENRTEAQLNEDYDLLGLHIEHTSDSGVSLSYVDDTTEVGVNQFVSDPYDISQDSPVDLYSLYGVPGFYPNGLTGSTIASPYFGTVKLPYVSAVPGYPGFGADSGTSNTHTMGAQVGLFSQNTFKFNDQWSWVIGGRATFIHAQVDNPFPIAGVLPDDAYSLSGDFITPSANTSLLYKPVPWTTIYATYNYSQAIAGNTYKGYVTGSNYQLDPADFHRPSVLYEGGAKFEFIPNKLYGTVDGYYQERALTPVATSGGPAYSPNIRVRGVDATLEYQPDKHLTVGANFSWINANYVNASVGGLGVFSPLGFVANNETVFQDHNAFGEVSNGNYRVSGIPDQNFNAYAKYKLDSGWGVGADLWVRSSWQYHVASNIDIPAEYNLDFSAFYEQPSWYAQVDFLNVTNQLNFEPQIGESSDFLQPLEPFGIQAKFGIKF